MTKMLKKLISITLVLSMVLGSVCFIFADTKTINYVAIGDSYSNGFGFEFTDWKDPEDTYPGIFAQYLRTSNPGATVNLNTNFCLDGQRFNDLKYILSDGTLNPDSYTPMILESYVGSSPEAVAQRKAYINAIKNADVITIKLGYNNFMYYLVSRFQYDFNINGVTVKVGDKLTDAFTEKELAQFEEIKEYLEQILEAKIGTGVLAQFQNSIDTLLSEIKIGKSTLGDYVDLMAYSIVSGLRDYDACLRLINDYNDHAQIYVLQLSNPISDLTLTYDIGTKKTVNIPVGEILGSLIDVFNLYYAVGSINSAKTVFVADNEAPVTFVEKIAKDDNFAKQMIKADCIRGGISNGEELANTYFGNLQDYAKCHSFSINNLLFNSDLESLMGTMTSLFANKIDQVVSIDFDTANEAQKLAVLIYLYGFMLSGSGIHPTKDSNEVTAEALEKSYSRMQKVFNADSQQSPLLSNVQAAKDGGLSVPKTLASSIQLAQTKAANPAINSNSNTINYVSLGDSNSMPYSLASMNVVKGGETYNLEGYKVDTSNTLKNEKGEKLSDISKISWLGRFATELATIEGKTVTWDNLAIAGGRTEELHMFLDYAVTADPYTGDGYTDSFFTGWILKDIAAVYDYGTEASEYLTKMSLEYIDKISNADVITIELGDNNYGAAMIYELTEGLTEGGNSLRLQNLLDNMGSSVDIDSLKKQFFDLLEMSLGSNFDRATATTIDKILDYLVYSYLSFAYNFEYDIQRIYSLNKNPEELEIYVTSHNNTIEDWSINLGTTTISYGSVLSVLYQMMDLYVGTLSSYSDTYHFVDFNSVNPEGLWQSVLKDSPDQYDRNFMDGLVESKYGITVDASNRDSIYAHLKEAVLGSNYIINGYSASSETDEAKKQQKKENIKNFVLTGEASDKDSVYRSVASDIVMFYDYGAGLHCNNSGHIAKANAMIDTYKTVQKTGITAREYCTYKALGLYDLKDKMQLSVDDITRVSSAIVSNSEALTQTVKDTTSQTLNVYGNWSALNETVNAGLNNLSKIGPLSSVLANTLKLAKNQTNVSLLIASYIYENGGYETVNSGSTATIISNKAASSFTGLKTALKLSADPTVITVNGSKTAQELISKTSSDIYIVDVDAGDVKIGSTIASKLVVDATLNACKSLIKKNIAFLVQCGILDSNEIETELIATFSDAVTRTNSIAGALAIESAVHNKDKAAIVAYLGRTDGSVISDITNLSLFTSAMFTDNTVYVDRQSDSNTVSQITKHLKTEEASKRDYTDNIKSVVVNNLNRMTSAGAIVNSHAETVSTELQKIIDNFPVTTQIIKNNVEQIVQDGTTVYDNMKNNVNNAIQNIYNIFKK